MKTYDAIIIGAGVVGCSIAKSLSEQGLKTCNIDTLPVAGYGSTSYSSAIIRPFYSHAEAASLAHEARSRWCNWDKFIGVSDDKGLATYTECGLTTLLIKGEEESFKPNLKAMGEAGVRVEYLRPKDLGEKFPGISLTSYSPAKTINDKNFGTPNGKTISGAIHVPEAGFVNDPQLATHNLFMAAKKAGGEFLFNSSVIEVLKSDVKVEGVKLKDGKKIFAPIIVNAAGPHSFQINDLVGLDMALTTRPLRHEITYIEAPSPNQGKPVLIDVDNFVYMKPDGADLLIGTLDPPCDTHDEVDPDDYNSELTEQWTNQAWRAGLRFEELGIPNTARGAVALYDVSNDWVPIYDKTEIEGYFLAIGTSGNQFKNAPMIGDLMATIIMGVKAGHDHDNSPLTLRLETLGKTISLGHYSRLRKINETSNVMA